MTWLHKNIIFTRPDDNLTQQNAAYLECKGTHDQCVEYCSKEQTRVSGPYFYNCTPKKRGEQGKREDLERIKEMLKEGKSLRAVAEDFPSQLAAMHKGIRALQSLLLSDVPRVPLKDVILMFGPTGCGKSRLANEMTGGSSVSQRWRVPVGGKGWFDNYDQHPFAILEEFTGASSHLRLDDFLQLTDRYKVAVPVKGNFVWWNPHTIIFTTNIHPSAWYQYENREGQYTALARRFTKVIWWRPLVGEATPPSPTTILHPTGFPTRSTLEWDHFWRGPAQPAINESELPRGRPYSVASVIPNIFNW